MATIAQGITAGNLANGLTSLPAFIQGLQAAVAAGGQLTQMSFNVTGQIGAMTFNPPGNLSVADTATLLNEIASLCNALAAEWTAQLNAI